MWPRNTGGTCTGGSTTATSTHRAPADSYRANERIGRNYDDMAPGLSQYIHDAIVANADRAASQ